MLSLILLTAAPCVSAHGGMVWPPSWQDASHTTLETRWNHTSGAQVRDPNSGKKIHSVIGFLTDQAYTGGHGDEFYGVGPVAEIDQRNVRTFDKCGRKCMKSRNPWSAPGMAPNLGGGCGVFGGNPFGCPKDRDSRPPGSRCGQDAPNGRGGRGTSSFGTSALEIDFPEAAVTDWQLGSIQVSCCSYCFCF